MALSVVSLRDHRYLPIGEDGRGGPVYAVYTDAAGAYRVFVPAAERDNVVVVASVPGGEDPRLAYNHLQAPGGAGEVEGMLDALAALKAAAKLEDDLPPSAL